MQLTTERELFSDNYQKHKHELRRKKLRAFKTGDISKFEMSDPAKYKPGADFTTVEKYMLDKDTKRLRWMRHMWAFFNAQALKEIDLYMHLKINRTSKLVLNYFKGMGKTIENFSAGYQSLSPMLDLPLLERPSRLFWGEEDSGRQAAREARRQTFFGSPFEKTPDGLLNLPIM